MKSTYRLNVRGYELDSFGHVNNAVYLQYAEVGMWHCLKKTGALDVVQAEGLFPVILETKLRYLHELTLMEDVRIDTEVHGSGGLAKYRHDIYNETAGKLSCRVTGKLAFVNRERIICDIPDKVIEIMESEDYEN